MAYARKGDDSDIHLFLESGYVCESCTIAPTFYGEDEETGLPKEGKCSLVFETPAEVLQHLFKHAANGDRVPDHVITRLVEDVCEGVEVI